MNATEAEDLVATARGTGLFGMEAMWTRFLPHIVEIRRLLAQGAVGDIVTVTADHGQWFARIRTSACSLRSSAAALSWISACIPVSFASMVLGEPGRIVALVDPVFTGDGQTSTLFGYAGGAQGVRRARPLPRSPTRAGDRRDRGRSRSRACDAPSAFDVISRTGRASNGTSSTAPKAVVSGTRPRRSPARLREGSAREPADASRRERRRSRATIDAVPRASPREDCRSRPAARGATARRRTYASSAIGRLSLALAPSAQPARTD